MIGAEPHTDWLDGIVERDETGFVITGRDLDPVERPLDSPLDWVPSLLETSIPGVFAAGDIRHGSVKRVTTAMGEGATVVQLVNQHLAEARQVPASATPPGRSPVSGQVRGVG
jgi:thioredoxin reductase (NADPH)